MTKCFETIRVVYKYLLRVVFMYVTVYSYIFDGFDTC